MSIAPMLPGLPALAELRAIPQWVCWRYEQRKGEKKPTKVPYSANTPFKASVDKPASWGTYEQAIAQQHRRGHDGVGIVLTPELGLVAIDLDDCVDEAGNIVPWVREILDLQETYAEITPSGRGMRLWARGQIERAITDRRASVEIYATGRYLTVTGDHLEGSPGEILEAPRALEACIARAMQGRAEREAAKPAQPDAKVVYVPREDRAPPDELEELLSWISADCPYDDWLKVLMSVHATTDGAGVGLDLVDAWSAGAPQRYPGRAAIEAKWRSFRRTGIESGTLARMAEEAGADPAEIAWRWRVAPYLPADDGFDVDTMAVGKIGKPVPIEPEHEPITADVSAISYPPGLVGDLARWIVSGARRPQPAMAIGAALVLVGTAAGRQFRGPEGMATHLYVLGLAPTGGGKDWPLQIVPRLLNMAGLSQHIGPSEFTSMPAVVGFLKDKPLSVCAMDEFGDFMRRINNKRASGFERSISKVLRSLWSLGFGVYTTPQWADRSSQTIHAPALSIFGASTPAQFYEAMADGSLEDGTMNRFIVVGSDKRPERQSPPPFDHERARHFAARLSEIYLASGELAATWRNDGSMNPDDQENGLVQLEWGRGAKERFEEIADEAEEAATDPLAEAFVVRVAEQSVRLATVIAIGRGSPTVDLTDLEWGYNLAAFSADFMRLGAAEYMAENQTQADIQKIMRVIRKRGGVARYRDIARSVQTIKAKDLKDYLEHLKDTGQIEEDSESVQRRKQGGGWPARAFSLRK